MPRHSGLTKQCKKSSSMVWNPIMAIMCPLHRTSASATSNESDDFT